METRLNVLRQQGAGWPVNGSIYGLLAVATAVVTVMAYRHVGVPSKHFRAVLALSGAASALATVAASVACGQWRWNAKDHSLKTAIAKEVRRATVSQAPAAAAPVLVMPTPAHADRQQQPVFNFLTVPGGMGAGAPAYAPQPAYGVGATPLPSPGGSAYPTGSRPLALMPPTDH